VITEYFIPLTAACGVTALSSPSLHVEIEVDLGKRCWYHSVFACPILRQQTTDSNPPMKLVCGHIISKDALNKMINGSKLKCPYCPMEQVPSDAKQIYF
uniref:RING-Gid-type domain-containing protein n=1 Tax=Paramormyrops kingsleyae TaxID=1676925 RepID=A0A3B3RTC3_9TELE